jgi:hypothetical protein
VDCTGHELQVNLSSVLQKSSLTVLTSAVAALPHAMHTTHDTRQTHLRALHAMQMEAALWQQRNIVGHAGLEAKTIQESLTAAPAEKGNASASYVPLARYIAVRRKMNPDGYCIADFGHGVNSA